MIILVQAHAWPKFDHGTPVVWLSSPSAYKSNVVLTGHFRLHFFPSKPSIPWPFALFIPSWLVLLVYSSRSSWASHKNVQLLLWPTVEDSTDWNILLWLPSIVLPWFFCFWLRFIVLIVLIHPTVVKVNFFYIFISERTWTQREQVWLTLITPSCGQGYVCLSKLFRTLKRVVANQSLWRGQACMSHWSCKLPEARIKFRFMISSLGLIWRLMMFVHNISCELFPNLYQSWSLVQLEVTSMCQNGYLKWWFIPFLLTMGKLPTLKVTVPAS